MLIWAVSSFLQIFCQHVLLAQNSVCVLSLGYEFVARRCKTYKGLEWLQLNPLFWPVSQTVLSCTHAAVRDFFFFIVVNMTTELLLLNEQTHLSACVCAVWIGTSFSDFNSMAIIPLFSIHWKYFCATFCQSSLVFLGSYRPHLTPRCFSLRTKNHWIKMKHRCKINFSNRIRNWI